MFIWALPTKFWKYQENQKQMTRWSLKHFRSSSFAPKGLRAMIFYLKLLTNFQHFNNVRHFHALPVNFILSPKTDDTHMLNWLYHELNHIHFLFKIHSILIFLHIYKFSNKTNKFLTYLYQRNMTQYLSHAWVLFD